MLSATRYPRLTTQCPKDLGLCDALHIGLHGDRQKSVRELRRLVLSHHCKDRTLLRGIESQQLDMCASGGPELLVPEWHEMK